MDTLIADAAAQTTSWWLTPEWLSLIAGLIAWGLRTEVAIASQREAAKRSAEDRRDQWNAINGIREDNEQCSRERGQLAERVTSISREQENMSSRRRGT